MIYYTIGKNNHNKKHTLKKNNCIVIDLSLKTFENINIIRTLLK